MVQQTSFELQPERMGGFVRNIIFKEIASKPLRESIISDPSLWDDVREEVYRATGFDGRISSEDEQYVDAKDWFLEQDLVSLPTIMGIARYSERLVHELNTPLVRAMLQHLPGPMMRLALSFRSAENLNFSSGIGSEIPSLEQISEDGLKTVTCWLDWLPKSIGAQIVMQMPYIQLAKGPANDVKTRVDLMNQFIVRARVFEVA